MEENVIDKLIKYWEERLGIELDKDERKIIRHVAYRMVDELIERRVSYFVCQSQRLKSLDLDIQ